MNMFESVYRILGSFKSSASPWKVAREEPEVTMGRFRVEGQLMLSRLAGSDLQPIEAAWRIM
jgi:hypothetical protein